MSRMEAKKKRNVKPKPERESFSIYVGTAEKSVLEYMATSQNLSVSALLRKIIKSYLDEVADKKKE